MALLYGFGDLLYAFLLVINAIAVLSEERFLARVGWSSSQATQQAYSGYEQAPEESIKQRLVHLIAAVRTLLRIPLIGLNILVIAYELVLGG